MSVAAADPLSATFAALADPTRRAILERLVDGPASVGELARPFAISLPAVSRHLKVLEHAGLIAREPEAQWRRCRLEPVALAGVAEWIERYRHFWEESFGRLDAFLKAQQVQSKERDNGPTDKKARARRRGRR